MWAMLFASVSVLALFVFLPAYLLLRAFGAPRILSFAAAPLVASSVYSLEAIIFAKIGIFASWASITLPLAVLGAVAFAASALRKRAGAKQARFGTGLDLSGARLGLFLAAGIIATALFYIYPMESADVLICGNDIVHHVSLNLAFLETGNWSTLETATTPGDPGAFYPSLWSLFAALPMSAIGTSPVVASHATNILTIAVIYPACSYLLAESLFGKKPLAVCMMGLLALAFLGFPWELFLRKTLLYPNVLGFALLPGALACFMLCFGEGQDRQGKAKAIALAFAGICAISLAHPNTFFTAAVFIFAFLLNRFALEGGRNRKLASRIILGAIMSAAAILIWVALSKSPFMASVVANPHGIGTEHFLIGGLARIAVLKPPHLGTQALLSLFLAVGFFSLFRKGEKHWILLPFAIMALLYSLSISLDPGTLKSMLTGFWYNHPVRTFASVTMFAIPLAALGASFLIEFALKLAKRARKGRPRKDQAATGSLGVTKAQAAMGLAFAVAAFALPLPLPAAMSCTDLIPEMRSYYHPYGQTSFFTGDERQFMQEVDQVVPEGARILNMPNDGSAFAYALYGTNVSGRDFYNSETCVSVLGSQLLEGIEAGRATAQELKDSGFDYVVVLDAPSGKDSTIYRNRFDKDQWKGMFRLNGSTPGLNAILQRDDMTLYEIEGE